MNAEVLFDVDGDDVVADLAAGHDAMYSTHWPALRRLLDVERQGET